MLEKLIFDLLKGHKTTAKPLKEMILKLIFQGLIKTDVA